MWRRRTKLYAVEKTFPDRVDIGTARPRTERVIRPSRAPPSEVIAVSSKLSVQADGHAKRMAMLRQDTADQRKTIVEKVSGYAGVSENQRRTIVDQEAAKARKDIRDRTSVERYKVLSELKEAVDK